MLQLLLASQSPRRKMILEKEGYSFQRLSVEVSEILDENLNFTDQICEISRTKVEAAINHAKGLNLKNYLLLTADTAVGFLGKTLGKPKNFEEAKATLRLLSGKTHQVCTAFSLWNSQEKLGVTDFDLTDVTFKNLSESQISDYVESGEPMDKAGSYGLQDVKAIFVKSVKGCELNVIGLPLPKIEKVLAAKKWQIK